MRSSLLLLLLLLLLCAATLAHANVTLTRKKRALTFPKGTSFVLTTAIVKPVMVKVPMNWNLDLEFDMTWPVPEGLAAYKPPPPRRKPFRPHRRHRRQLYANLELALDSRGLPGNQCILRAICEAKFILNPPGVSLAEDLLRVVFSYPRAAGSDRYDVAFATEDDCHLHYPCPVSILDFLLNYNNDLVDGK